MPETFVSLRVGVLDGAVLVGAVSAQIGPPLADNPRIPGRWIETNMNATALFHLAFPVHDLAQARRFYGDLLGCREGRSSLEWVDFDFYGHQIVAHLSPKECGYRTTSEVDGEDVPVRHFGAILPMEAWDALAERLKSAGTRFVIEPQVRFKGQIGEQATMFFLDPSGNALEFKAFGDIGQVFAK